MKTKARPQPKSGVCRYCRCTHTKPCFPPCCWIDKAETVCSADVCYQKAVKDGLKLIPGASMMSLG